MCPSIFQKMTSTFQRKVENFQKRTIDFQKKPYIQKRQQKQKHFCFQKINHLQKDLEKTLFFCFKSLLFKQKRENACENKSQTSKTDGLFKKNPSTTHLFRSIFYFSLIVWFLSKKPQNEHFFENGCSTEIFPVPLWPRHFWKNKKDREAGCGQAIAQSLWLVLLQLLSFVSSTVKLCRTQHKKSFFQQTIFFSKILRGTPLELACFFPKSFDRKKELEHITKVFLHISICISFEKKKNITKNFFKF